MIVIHASIPIDPDRRDEALDLVKELAESSRAEEGIINYRATTDVNDPNVLRFIEQYKSEAAVEAHLETEHFKSFEEALPDLIAGEPEVLQFEVESVSELEL